MHELILEYFTKYNNDRFIIKGAYTKWHIIPLNMLNIKLPFNFRYESIVPGDPQLIVLYRDRMYYFECEEKLQKFLRSACVRTSLYSVYLWLLILIPHTLNKMCVLIVFGF